jgi:AraC-like DNA-binding protein
LSIYEDALRCAVSFEKGTDLVIWFDATLLTRQNVLRIEEDGLPTAPEDTLVPVTFDLTDRQLLASLHRMIEVAALWGRLTLAESARTLGLPSRSLQRRLALIGTTFEQVVDDWRHNQALSLLSSPTGSTNDTAARLGYTDPSHFIRAFRRWKGVSPTEFRLGLARNGN